MKPNEITHATDRVAQMEQLFDRLLNAERTAPALLRTDAACADALQQLIQYYESGDWLRDYTLDEQGLLPTELKRGVLSQDAVYDFLCRRQTAAKPTECMHASDLPHGG